MPPKASSKSAPAAPEAPATYKESDIVLAKVKGYPSWPGRVVDASSASKKVLKEKPVKGKNLYLVQFFPTGDFAWSQPRDLSLLQAKEIDAFINGPGKKKGDLLQGYQIAKDPAEWITEKDDIAAEVQKREAEAEDDELASETESKPKKAGKKETTKKRKRESTATNGAKKDEKKKSKKESTKKASVKKDYTDDEAEPASKKAKASGDSDAETVKGWRHKLQKIFLGKTEPPADEMPKCAEIFDAMEKFEMKKEWLIESKLAKVLKRVALLKDEVIPDEEKYNFRQRSSSLAAKWAPIVGGNAAGSPQAEPSTSAADNSTEAAPATENGTESAPKESGDAAGESSEEKKGESEAMDVDTNGDAAKPEGEKQEEESKKDEQESS
ncbi:hypothetical protein JCM5350_006063 [Sporobolomyces pararoseus]